MRGSDAAGSTAPQGGAGGAGAGRASVATTAEEAFTAQVLFKRDINVSLKGSFVHHNRGTVYCLNDTLLHCQKLIYVRLPTGQASAA